MIIRCLLLISFFLLIGKVQSNLPIAEVVYTSISVNKPPVKKKQAKATKPKKQAAAKFYKETVKTNSSPKGRWGWLVLSLTGLLLFIMAAILLIVWLFPGPGQMVFPILVIVIAAIPFHQALLAIPIGIVAWFGSEDKAKLFKELHGKTIQEMKADLKQKVNEEQASLSVKDKKKYASYQLNIAELLVEIKALESSKKNAAVVQKRIGQKKLKIERRKQEIKALEALTS